jgi:hypothetical protein
MIVYSGGANNVNEIQLRADPTARRSDAASKRRCAARIVETAPGRPKAPQDHLGVIGGDHDQLHAHQPRAAP